MNQDILTRAATFEPSTFDAEKRTIRVIFSTGADVMRSDYEGYYFERLDMSPDAVDLSQLRGAPVLDNHDRFGGVNAILGVVETAAVDGKRGEATLRFGSRPEIAGIVGDIGAGIIRSVSAGYTVQQWTVGKRADGARVKTATKWTPKEISFVPIGADPKAQVRSQQGEDSMDLQTQLRTIAQAVNVPETFADGIATRDGVTIEQARAAIIAEAARLQPVIDTRRPLIQTRDQNDNLIERMADGLRARMNPAHKPTDAGREFASMRFADYARRCLERAGLSTLGSPNELIQRAMHTTSDFPNVLSEVFHKELLQLAMSPSPIQQIFRKTTMSDFRARHIMEISDGPGLDLVNEKGEVTFGSISDNELASYSVKSYAKAFSISFQALINDDMAAFADIVSKMTNGARRWFDGLLVDTIVSNPTLADTYAVFASQHGNLAASGAVPSETTLAAAKLAVRLQTDLSGNPIGAAPKYIVFPAALEATMDRLMATLYPVQPEDAQVSGRNLSPIVDPRFDAKGQSTAWYLFASPSEAPVFEYAELEGLSGPQVETRQGFTTLGTEVRVVWHVGAGAVDHRGGYKNPGA